MQKKESVAKQHIRKADIFLMIVCLLSALLSGIWFFLRQQDGTMLRISYDGSVLYTMDLNANSGVDAVTAAKGERYLLITYAASEQEPDISVSSGKPDIPAGTAYNLLCVTAKGEVHMEAADCRDQICVHHKPITGSRESIICLPHKLAVEIVGSTPEDDALDGMVQ